MRRRHAPRLDYEYIKIEQRLEMLEKLFQTVGFSPDYPYRILVDDGVTNRILIGKIED